MERATREMWEVGTFLGDENNDYQKKVVIITSYVFFVLRVTVIDACLVATHCPFDFC